MSPHACATDGDSLTTLGENDRMAGLAQRRTDNLCPVPLRDRQELRDITGSGVYPEQRLDARR